MNKTIALRFKTPAIACIICVMGGHFADAAYIPVYDGPEYDVVADTGYVTILGSPYPFSGSHLNNGGTIVGVAKKIDSGSGSGLKAVRWDSSGAAAPELGQLEIPATGHKYTQSLAHAVNDSGIAVGVAMTGFNERLDERPVRWDAAGNATPLDVLDTAGGGGFFAYGQAFAVNNSGTAVGYADEWDGLIFSDRAVRWDVSGTAVTALGDLAPIPYPSLQHPESRALAVNDSGIAVGWAEKANPNGTVSGHRAVRWDASGAASELELIGAVDIGSGNAEARDINEDGTAVGWAAKVVSGESKGIRAIRWDGTGTTATELGDLGTDSEGTTGSKAYKVNDSGAAVGYAEKYVSGIDMGSRAVRWDPTGTVALELDILGTDANGKSQGTAYQINNKGIAVGYVSKYVSNVLVGDHAVAWKLDGSVIDLNSLIDPASGWILASAYEISDTGWVTGNGWFDPDGPGELPGYNRVFLLKLPQVPEPCTLLLAALAGVGAWAARRKSPSAAS